ncbi:MAG: hypothetical protein F6K17_19030 [Okeania sp. SIO3C4]|nr:hypothetical protein [Okeania sp. SIO3B3]NER04551.1 hypothetical protein [Okeania sp. SIO3C4]
MVYILFSEREGSRGVGEWGSGGEFGVVDLRYDIIGTYAETLHTERANAIRPYRWWFKGKVCVSPDRVRIRARTKNFLLLLLFLPPDS